MLVKQLAQRPGKKCVVGDDDQAIYGWRGADVRHMLSFQNDFARRAAEHDIAYEGMAILYRTNAQSRPLEEAFRFRGIPYRLIGAISFYERREVKDLLAYMRLIANPADDEAFLRVVNVPRRGVGDASLAVLGKAAAGWQKPLLEAARRAGSVSELRPNVREGLAGVAALVDRLRDAV